MGEDRTETDVLESMWGLVCNVSGGDWELQSEEWQEAAVRIREEYFALLKSKTKEDETA